MIKVIERLGVSRRGKRGWKRKGASNLKIHWKVNPRRIRDNSPRKSQPASSLEAATFARRKREKRKAKEKQRAALKTTISPGTYLTRGINQTFGMELEISSNVVKHTI